MIGAVARKLFGSSNDRRIRAYRPRVDEINALENQLQALSDDALRARTEQFKREVAEGRTLDDIDVSIRFRASLSDSRPRRHFQR